MQTRTRQLSRPNLKLFALRVNEGLSREALALRTGVSKETIRKAERYSHVPDVMQQMAIAEAFNRRPLDIWPIEQQRVRPRRSPRRAPV